MYIYIYYIYLIWNPNNLSRIRTLFLPTRSPTKTLWHCLSLFVCPVTHTHSLSNVLHSISLTYSQGVMVTVNGRNWSWLTYAAPTREVWPPLPALGITSSSLPWSWSMAVCRQSCNVPMAINIPDLIKIQPTSLMLIDLAFLVGSSPNK